MRAPDIPEMVIVFLLVAGLGWAFYNFTHPAKGTRG